MRIVSWNVNSVRARLERLAAFLRRTGPDVVCLQELKCQESDLPRDELLALGYRTAAFGQRTYNGVAILARDEPGDVLRGLDDGIEDVQARVVSATVHGVRVYSVYAPNGQAVGSEAFQYKLAFYDRLRAHLARRHRPSDSVVLCGDFNIAPSALDVYDPAAWEGQTLCTDVERDRLEALLSWGLCDTFRLHHAEGGRYSWWDYRQLGFPKNRGLRIDHVYASRALADRCTAADIERDERKGKQPSDHAPVWAELALTPSDGPGPR